MKQVVVASNVTTMNQIKSIAARVLPRHAPESALSNSSLFVARVMSAGTWDEVKAVMEYFGRPAFRSALDSPPSKIFDEPSWHLWHSAFGQSVPDMPAEFFTVYPWFRDRAQNNRRFVSAAEINQCATAKYDRAPVVSVDEENVL